MPLYKGKGSIRRNMNELMQPPQSAARKKAIMTLARKHNITLDQAQARQARAIASAQARKR